MADAVIDPNKKGMEATNAYLAQGAGEDLNALRSRFASLLAPSHFNQGGGITSGALADKINSQGAQNMDDINASFDRNMPFLYADRLKKFQGVSDANQEILRQEDAIRAQQMAAKKAKQRALTTGLVGLAGAGAGAYFGGPAGAQIGGGIGSLAGSQF
jgi:hypothetical protein